MGTRVSEQLPAAADGMADAFIACSAEGRVLSWNAGAEELFGLAAHEVVGRRLRSFVDPERRADVWALARRGLDEGTADTIEVEERLRDGASSVLSLTFLPAGEQGSEELRAVTIRDVTRQQAAGRRGERLFRAIEQALQRAPLGVAVLDREGVVEYAAGGIGADDPGGPELREGAKLREVLADRPEALMPVERALAGETYRGPIVVRDRVYEVTMLPIGGGEGADGRPDGAVGIALDVTEDRAEAERRLRTLRGLEAALVDAPVSIVATDSSGAVEFVAGAAANRPWSGDGPIRVGMSSEAVFGSRRQLAELARQTRHGKPLSATVDLGERIIAVSVSPTVDAQGAPAGGTVAIGVDITGQQRAEALDRELRRAQSLGTLAETTTALAGPEDLTLLLHRIAVRAREVTASDFAAISVFGEGGHLDRFIYDGISDADAQRLGSPPVGRGLLGELASHVQPIRIADLTAHPRYTGWPEGHPDMCAFLGVPIRVGQETLGSLYMTRTRGRAPFSEEDEVAGTLLSMQIAVAVATALAHERMSRVSLLEERVSIGQDLHDGTIQALYALALQSAAAAEAPDLDAAGLRAALDENVDRINGVIREIRGYIEGLQQTRIAKAPELASDLGDLIRKLVPEGVDVILQVSAPALQELSARAQEEFLFIAREAVSNAVRHGEPTKIAIDLRQTPDETALTVQDNGRGFDQFNFAAGLGSHTMRNRADRMGATLTTISLPGMGTTVRVTLPREMDQFLP